MRTLAVFHFIKGKSRVEGRSNSKMGVTLLGIVPLRIVVKIMEWEAMVNKFKLTLKQVTECLGREAWSMT